VGYTPEYLRQSADVMCNVAGALWRLAAARSNQYLITESGGIVPLVGLLAKGNQGAQEAAAGALWWLATDPKICDAISKENAIKPLAALIRNNAPAKEQAALCLSVLATASTDNQGEIARELVHMMSTGTPSQLECASQVARDLALETGGNHALDEAGAIPFLVQQIGQGTDQASENSARALAQVACVSDNCRSTITHQLISVRHAATSIAPDLKVAARAARALKSMNAEEDEHSAQAVGMAILLFRIHTRD